MIEMIARNKLEKNENWLISVTRLCRKLVILTLDFVEIDAFVSLLTSKGWIYRSENNQGAILYKVLAAIFDRVSNFMVASNLVFNLVASNLDQAIMVGHYFSVKVVNTDNSELWPEIFGSDYTFTWKKLRATAKLQTQSKTAVRTLCKIAPRLFIK